MENGNVNNKNEPKQYNIPLDKLKDKITDFDIRYHPEYERRHDPECKCIIDFSKQF